METRRTALVTGANRGIGYEVAKELAGRGMRVILTGRDPAAVAKAAAVLRATGGATAAFAMDVADRQAVERCARRLRGEGERVDVLVNNAAVYPGDTLLSTPAEVLQRTFETNWLRTRMGGGGATRSVEQGADTIVWLATLDRDGPNGGFFRDRKRIEW